MALHGSPEVTITLGGTTIDDVVVSGLTTDIESMMADVTTINDVWDQYVPIGRKKTSEITLEWNYDETVSGHDILRTTDDDPAATPMVFLATYASGRTYSVSVWRKKFDWVVDKDSQTKGMTVLLPTGAVTLV